MSRKPLALAALAAVAIGGGTLAPGTALARSVAVGEGELRAVIGDGEWRIRWVDRRGRTALRSVAARFDGSKVIRTSKLRRRGDAVVGVIRTADGRLGSLRVGVAGGGVARLRTAVPGAARARVSFVTRRRERFLGFGERSNRVDFAGHEVESYVADGPVREEDRPYTAITVPPWGERARNDATYFPIPWTLSSRGYGVLLDNDETSRFALGAKRWSAEVDAGSLRLRTFAGPRPADALRRFTAAVGRQPPPASRWSFGPWFQTGQPNVVPLADELAIIETLRGADVPVSAAETQMHYLPCGAQVGKEEYERRRNAQFHAAGLAHLAYLNPHLCVRYEPVYSEAAGAGVLQRSPAGGPFTYTAFVGGDGPLGFTREPIAQFDFTAPGAVRFYERLVRELVDSGKDGWMEDFGEYTPPVAVSADGTPGERMHNRYPTTYHCTVHEIAGRLERPLSRHQRSGWTGSARCADIVWGGDPTTVWGFDGLQSAVTQALSMGLSGVSRWGSDIGGYVSFGPQEQLTPELLRRWIQFGAVSAVMRTKRSGIAIPGYERPQVFDPAILPLWRRYTKLHTQLHPYLLAADQTYRRTGLPIMRHLILAHPQDRRAATADDQFLFGPDLMAAPVTTAGARSRQVYLPRGRWVDFWRGVGFRRRDGAFLPRRVRPIAGRRTLEVEAPVNRLPLFVRAGAILPLLDPEVDTLAPYDGPGVVTARERADRMTLLAFPRGRTSARFNEGEEISSRATDDRWVLRIDGARSRAYTVRAALGALREPFRPLRVLLDGEPLSPARWRFDRRLRTLTITARLRDGSLVVTR